MKISFTILSSFFLICSSFAQVKISENTNPTDPDVNAILELESTTLGFILSRLSTTNRPIADASNTGMLIYNTDDNQVQYCNGTSWIGLVAADNLGNHTATSNISMSGNYISRTGTSAGLYVDTDNKIGVNESIPQDLLHLTDAANGTRVRVENSSNGWAGMVSKNSVREIFIGIQGAFDANPGEFHIYDNTAGSRRLVIDAAGEVGIGRNNPSVKLDVNGSVNCTGGTCSSDIRWKKNIQKLTTPLANIQKLRGVSYYWKTKAFPDRDFSDDKQIGLIAQEVEQIYPELIKTDNEGYKSMDYMSLSAVLLEAIKEQQNEIEALKKQNNQQLSTNNELEARLERIERQLNLKSTANK